MIKYIIGHWTAGNYTPCPLDLKSYQLLIDSNGKEYKGAEIGKSASTGGMNSITYNISACGGLKNTPVKPVQIEAFYKICAIKLKEFDLTVDKFYTHAEIGEMVKNRTILKLLPNNKYLIQNIGKIDLTVLPEIKDTPQKTGNYIRNKIKWYLGKI